MAKRTYEENLELARSRGGVVESLPVSPCNQLCLEFWPDAARGVPNPVLRGALFGVSQIRTVHKNRTLIASTGDYQVKFKGETWNQTDLDTLCGMLHLVMPHPLGSRVEFSVNAFLKQLGRASSGEQHEEFKEQIARIMGGVIEVTSLKDKKTFMGTLIKSACRDDQTGRYVVVFNEKTLHLFQYGYTLIDWEYRQSLGKNNLAKWLHTFYSSHASPFDYKVETLRTLCGSHLQRLGDFRKALRLALDRLVAVGAIKSWAIGEFSDLVSVANYPTNAQRKYLAKSTRARRVR
jgi:hypothetical protein